MAMTTERTASGIVVRLSGEVSSRDLVEASAHLDHFDLNGPTLPRLIDARRVTGIGTSYPEMAGFAEVRARSSPAQDTRTAILVDSDAAFGIATLYQGLLSTDRLEVKVFREQPEALAWLGMNSLE